MNIVQIGTNRANDDVTKLAQEHKNDLKLLLLVEPMKSHNDFIHDCYKDYPMMVLENVCITETNSQDNVTMWFHQTDGPGFQCTSIKKEHILKHAPSPEGLLEEKFPTMTLPALLRKYGLKTVDVLCVDAEGTDDKLIQSLDLDEFDIKRIVFEHLHIDAESLIEYLRGKGYEITRNVGADKFSHEANKICQG
jgi:hypothetical protein